MKKCEHCGMQIRDQSTHTCTPGTRAMTKIDNGKKRFAVPIYCKHCGGAMKRFKCVVCGRRA